MKNVIVIGSGVAGLGAAFKLKRAADAGHDVSYTVIEKDPRVGGKVATDTVEAAGGTFIVDGGPDSYLTSKPAIPRIAGLTGIAHDTLPADESRKKTLILSRGKLFEMPDGVMMFAPTKFVPFATTGLFSWPGKVRMGWDLFVPKKQVPEGALNDETLESFIVRRMGRECLDRLAEPLVGGVHGSDPAVMSLAATFPNLLDMEQKHGSMLRGFLASRKAVEEMKRKYPPQPGAKPRTFFTSFTGGMQELTDSMADAVGRENIVTGTAVTGLKRADGGWTVTLSDGRALEADAVVVTTEGWAAAELMKQIDAEAAAALGEIQHSGSATVSVGFDTEDVGFDLDAFGVLCPIVEKRNLMAVTISSTKWPGRAPAGKTLLRGFVGGPHNQRIMDVPDEQLVDTVVADMRDILGLKAAPVFTRVYRWHSGMPQYTMGHLGRLGTIFGRLETIPGLAVGGGAYTGVGLPNCIESGEAAVTKVMSDLGVALEEDAEPRTAAKR